MITVKPQVEDPEKLVREVFFEVLDILGGLKRLAEFRTLTWLPSLARASYVLVLREYFGKSEEEIAKELGITKQTVRNILRAKPEEALERIKNLEDLAREEREDERTHIAGGIARVAYERVKERLGE
jgi:probable regulatory domain-containing protein